MEESLSYMDQCTVICLGYISCYGSLEIRSGEAKDPENLESLCTIADQELTEFGNKEELQIFFNSSASLVEKFKNSDNDEETFAQSVMLLQGSLDQEVFNGSVDLFINHPVESWDQVSQVLHLIYRVCEQQDNAKVGSVIDVGVRYMRKNLTDFIMSQGGWRSLGVEKNQELEQFPREDDGISSSIVVVSNQELDQSSSPKLEIPEGAGDAATAGKSSPDQESVSLQDTSALSSPKNRPLLPLSPLSTPPFSIPSSTNTDDDRDSLATPPEMVEKPLMTDSFIRAMGGEEMRRVSSGNGNDFEIIGSENGAASTGNQSMVQSIDDVEAYDPPTEKEDIFPEQSSSMQSESQAPSNVEVSASEITKSSVPEAKEPSNEESLFGGYLPHISLGVAAAAAVAGFFVIKKHV